MLSKHDSFLWVTWLIRMCDMTHWYVWHNSLVCATWLISSMCADEICVPWLIATCDMTHSMCVMTHWYHPHIWIWHDLYHPYVLWSVTLSKHDSHSYMWAMSHLNESREVHIAKSHVTWSTLHISIMNSICTETLSIMSVVYRVAKTHRMPYKLQVIFHKRATNYRVLLQELTNNDNTYQ